MIRKCGEESLTAGGLLSTFSPVVTVSKAHQEASQLDLLPMVFSYQEVITAGVGRRQLYGGRDAGLIEVVGRGLFRKPDDSLADLTWIEVQTRAPSATMCLTSALAFHELSDAIPLERDLALPRGTRHPQMTGPVRWHSFDTERFEIGREVQEVEQQVHIGVYSAERSIVDTFRLSYRQGKDEAHEALRRWIRRPGTQPSALLEMAANFPRSVTPIRRALTVLL
jgi:hypothetical protein